jgi:hypothetical protein
MSDSGFSDVRCSNLGDDSHAKRRRHDWLGRSCELKSPGRLCRELQSWGRPQPVDDLFSRFKALEGCHDMIVIAWRCLYLFVTPGNDVSAVGPERDLEIQSRRVEPRCCASDESVCLRLHMTSHAGLKHTRLGFWPLFSSLF